jgi:hypothetical protein
MTSKLTRAAYEAMIDENLAWLDAQPHSLEREHIREIIRRSPMHEYADPAPSTMVERERALVRAAFVEGRMHEGQRGGWYADPDGVRADFASETVANEVESIIAAVDATHPRPALTQVAPSVEAAAYERGLRDAAKVCDAEVARATKALAMPPSGDVGIDDMVASLSHVNEIERLVCIDLAARIRALSTAPATPAPSETHKSPFTPIEWWAIRFAKVYADAAEGTSAPDMFAKVGPPPAPADTSTVVASIVRGLRDGRDLAAVGVDATPVDGFMCRCSSCASRRELVEAIADRIEREYGTKGGE